MLPPPNRMDEAAVVKALKGLVVSSMIPPGQTNSGVVTIRLKEKTDRQSPGNERHSFPYSSLVACTLALPSLVVSPVYHLFLRSLQEERPVRVSSESGRLSEQSIFQFLAGGALPEYGGYSAQPPCPVLVSDNDAPVLGSTH